MFKLGALIFGLGLVAAYPAWAGDEPKVDCNNAMTQTDMNICSYQDWQKADKELNAVYRKALKFASHEDAMYKDQPELKGAVKALKKAQRAWIDYRDGQCEGYGFGARGGTMEPLLVSGCAADLTRKRSRELKELMAYPEDVPDKKEQK